MADPPVKGFRLTDIKRSRTYGVGCRNFDELVTKTRKKFELDEDEIVHFYLADGTVVESQEYFSSLPSQTKLIFARSDETVVTDADIIYETLSAMSEDILKAGEMVDRFFDEKIKEKVRALSKLTETETAESELGKTLASRRSQHPEWFEGLETRCTTKEDYMSRRCADRMRAYLYRSGVDVRKSAAYVAGGTGMRSRLDWTMATLKRMLQRRRSMGFYFDRTSPDNPFCDKSGSFNCNGPWYLGKCEHRGGLGHTINPYSSKEKRILFSTWNLDHRIERARSVVPAILEAARLSCDPSDGGYTMNGLTGKSRTKLKRLRRPNVDYFFELLFTDRNLGLVHAVCHDKAVHEYAGCDAGRITIPVLEEAEDGRGEHCPPGAVAVGGWRRDGGGDDGDVVRRPADDDAEVIDDA